MRFSAKCVIAVAVICFWRMGCAQDICQKDSSCEHNLAADCTGDCVRLIKSDQLTLRFSRSEGSNVTTTIDIVRHMPASPVFFIEVLFNQSRVPDETFTCPEDHLLHIQMNGTVLGRISFPNSSNCSKAVIYFTPPPTLGIRLSLFVNNGGSMVAFGPFYIGQERIRLCEAAANTTGSRVTAWFTNITNCQDHMPPHDVMFSYGMNNLTWWMNGTISESQCFSVETFSCKTSNVMKFELFLDHRTCPITVNSLLRAGFVGGIQMDNCLEITREPTPIWWIAIIAVGLMIIYIFIPAVIVVIVLVHHYKNRPAPKAPADNTIRMEEPKAPADNTIRMEEVAKNTGINNPIKEANPARFGRNGDYQSAVGMADRERGQRDSRTAEQQDSRTNIPFNNN